MQVYDQLGHALFIHVCAQTRLFLANQKTSRRKKLKQKTPDFGKIGEKIAIN